MATDSVFRCTVTEAVNLGPEGDWHYCVTCPVERYWTVWCASYFYVPWSICKCGRVFNQAKRG